MCIQHFLVGIFEIFLAKFIFEYEFNMNFHFVTLPVDDGAILDIVLDDFNYGPSPGYDKIMLEQSLL